MSFKCFHCNKEFKYDSELIKHQNRKTPCNKIKEELNCDLCNLNFKWHADKIRHENTKKHITNINKENGLLEETQREELNKLKEDNVNLKEENDKLKDELNKLKKNLENKEMDNLKLKKENKILKNSEKVEHKDQIYIIHERTFVELNVNIYKIGRTNNIERRFKEYAKGSKLVFLIACKDSCETELKILNYLKNNSDKYIQEKDYGMEYFRCDLKELQRDVISLVE